MHALTGGRQTAKGSIMVTVVPMPTVDSSAMVPPADSTARFTRPRPMPVPAPSVRREK